MKSRFGVATARLRLYAPSLAEIHALIRGERAALEAHLQATLPGDWPGPNLTHSLPTIAAAMALEPGDARWVWMVIDPSAARVIGDIGFHGPLRAGATVEIGYIILPDARGHGYAAESVAALIHWTFTQTRVAQIIAQIDPANTASLRVAEKAGLRPLPPISAGHLRFGIERPPA